jgi:hypothetical protein
MLYWRNLFTVGPHDPVGAWEALRNGLNVLLFSGNVPIEDEATRLNTGIVHQEPGIDPMSHRPLQVTLARLVALTLLVTACAPATTLSTVPTSTAAPAPVSRLPYQKTH